MKASNGKVIDPSHIYIAGFWTNGSSSIYIDDVLKVTYDLDGIASVSYHQVDINNCRKLKFELVGKIEAEHEKRYQKVLENIEKGIVFKGDGVTVWKCRNCGYIHIGDSAPEECPVCKHPQSFFEIRAENY